MPEGPNFEMKPTLEIDGLESLSPPITVAEQYPVPAVIEREPTSALEQVRSTFDSAMLEPMKAQEQQLSDTEAQLSDLRATAATLETQLPEVQASQETGKINSLVTLLNDVDRRRIGLLQQEVYLTGDIRLRQQEVVVFDRERQGIIEELITLFRELLLGAKSELERLTQVRDVAKLQINVSVEDSLRVMGTLSQLELQLTDFTETQGDSPEVAAALSQAQSKITEARTKLIEQQQTETLELQRADDELRLLEDSATTYQHEIDALESELSPLLLEDLRDSSAGEPELLEDSRFEGAGEVVADSELLPTDTKDLQVDVDEPSGVEIIEDAEFEELTDEAVEDGPRVNDSLEMTGTETNESVSGEVS